MFGIGETELLIIVAFAFMVFGPDKLPGMGRTIGRALRQFREAQEDITKVVQAEVVDPLNDAMNEPDRGAAKRARAIADDADRDQGQDGTDTRPRRQETFAERKARLQAERASGVDVAATGSVANDAATPVGPAPETTVGNGVPGRDGQDLTASLLYSIRPQAHVDGEGKDHVDPPRAEGVSSDGASVVADDGEEEGVR